MDEGCTPADIAGDICFHCRHPWTLHSTDVGCTNGWAWDSEGVATSDGCRCPLANTEVGA